MAQQNKKKIEETFILAFPPEHKRRKTANTVRIKISDWIVLQWDTGDSNSLLLLYKYLSDDSGYPYGFEIDLKEAIQLYKALGKFLKEIGATIKDINQG